ncbi:hypothetical protein [Sporosarcina luteola]|uniref:hypothetical protein n=1 Tax=Sporosarcina luteola TaxID=582850 RepID=UPI00203FE984|nr:hypothetical protein [Sporosarcina luteola]
MREDRRLCVIAGIYERIWGFMRISGGLCVNRRFYARIDEFMRICGLRNERLIAVCLSVVHYETFG